MLASKLNATRLAVADMKEVSAQTAGMERAVDFNYRVPFPQFVEGFIVHYAGVPRLTEQYVRDQRRGNERIFSAKQAARSAPTSFDKNYFDAQAIMSCSEPRYHGNQNRRGSIPTTG